MENHLSGSALVARLGELVRRWHLLQHPFYRAWTGGRLDRSALQLYAAQYYRHVEAFPDHLRCLAARAEDRLHSLIEENLAEEESQARTHPQLWRDFAAALGVSDTTLHNCAPLLGTQVLVDTYRRICRKRSLTEAVAALYVYEAQVPEIATQKMVGLRRFYGVSDPCGLAYFAVHEEADVRHRAAWRAWLVEQPKRQAEGVLDTAEEALRALWGVLDAVYPQPTDVLSNANSAA